MLTFFLSRFSHKPLSVIHQDNLKSVMCSIWYEHSDKGCLITIKAKCGHPCFWPSSASHLKTHCIYFVTPIIACTMSMVINVNKPTAMNPPLVTSILFNKGCEGQILVHVRLSKGLETYLSNWEESLASYSTQTLRFRYLDWPDNEWT